MSEQDPLFEQATPRTAGLMVEAKLREWNLSYEYVEDFPVKDVRSVDWTQVRSGGNVFDGDTVGEFRTHMAHGAVFPPIVLMDNVLVDGNHRFAAAKGLKRKTIAAFTVKFNSVDLARAFAAAINQTNGRRLTNDEAANIAVTMRAQGMGDEAVAREIGRSVGFVQSTMRRSEFRRRSDNLPEIRRIMEEKPLPAKAQEKLVQIKHEPVFAEAVKLVSEVKAQPKTVAEIVEAANSSKSDADAITAIHAKRAELAPQGPGPNRVIVPEQVKLSKMNVGYLLKFKANAVALLDTALDDDGRKQWAERWALLGDLAAEMVKLYEAGE